MVPIAVRCGKASGPCLDGELSFPLNEMAARCNWMRAGWVLALGYAVACSSESKEDDGAGGLGSQTPVFGDGDLMGPDFGTDPDDPSEGPDGCVGQTAGTEALPAVLQLVVDTSGSMDQDAPGSRDSKWVVTREALLGAIGEMPDSTAVGVVFYPDLAITADTCFDNEADVPIALLAEPGSNQRSQIERAFARQSPDGGTPTHDAYRYAHRALAAARVTGARFAVVITDGTPTFSLGCEGTGLVSDPVDPGPLVTEAAQARTQGVSTFVIGSPGSEGARESLSRMAEAGGTARPSCSHSGPNYCHFDMTRSGNFASDLRDALGTISGLALSCAYDIPEPPSGQVLDPERVNVLFTPSGGSAELIAKSPSGSCREGWQYSDDGAQVLLCESTCDRVKGAQGSLSLEFGCATRVR
jgi:von Willebrand factor type A domain